MNQNQKNEIEEIRRENETTNNKLKLEIEVNISKLRESEKKYQQKLEEINVLAEEKKKLISEKKDVEEKLEEINTDLQATKKELEQLKLKSELSSTKLLEANELIKNFEILKKEIEENLSKAKEENKILTDQKNSMQNSLKNNVIEMESISQKLSKFESINTQKNEKHKKNIEDFEKKKILKI